MQTSVQNSQDTSNTKRHRSIPEFPPQLNETNDTEDFHNFGKYDLEDHHRWYPHTTLDHAKSQKYRRRPKKSDSLGSDHAGPSQAHRKHACFTLKGGKRGRSDGFQPKSDRCPKTVSGKQKHTK